MPTLEERVAALEAQTPRRSYTSMWSGEEIDRRLLNAAGRDLLDNSWWARKEAIVNQRGQSSYTGPVYGIDRWIVEQNATLQIMDDCISIDASYSSGIIQKLDYSTLPAPLTFSVLVKEGVGIIFFSNHTSVPIYGAGLYYITYPEGINLANDYAYIRAADNSNLKAIAAKLELGPTQTLAHKDAAGNWVLNDPPPDYGLELLKCQRYYNRSHIRYVCTKGGIYRQALMNVMFPVRMRGLPTVSLRSHLGTPGTLSYFSTGLDTDITAAVNNAYLTPDGFNAIAVDKVLADGETYIFQYEASADL